MKIEDKIEINGVECKFSLVVSFEDMEDFTLTEGLTKNMAIWWRNIRKKIIIQINGEHKNITNDLLENEIGLQNSMQMLSIVADAILKKNKFTLEVSEESMLSGEDRMQTI